MNEFKNRESNKLNRKKYLIEEIKEDGLGNIEEFIAYELRYDDEEDSEVTEEGTRLDAESLNQVVNYLAEQKTNKILQEKESELEEKINEISEVKIFQVLNNLNSYLDLEINKVILPDEFISEYELPINFDNNKIKVSWEAVSTNVQIINNKLMFQRNINSFNATIKSIFTCGYITKEKEYEITIKGTLNSNVNTNLEVNLEWIQGMNNSYEVVLETNDHSKLVYDLEEIYDNNAEVLEYLNLNITKLDETKINVEITEKSELINLNKSKSDTYCFFIDFYIDNIRNVNGRQLYIEIKYNYTSTEPED